MALKATSINLPRGDRKALKCCQLMLKTEGDITLHVAFLSLSNKYSSWYCRQRRNVIQCLCNVTFFKNQNQFMD